MNGKWPEIKILDFLPVLIGAIVFLFIIVNIILFSIFKKKDIRNKTPHKIVSLINICIELFIVMLVLYKGHTLFIIFAPFIIIFSSLLEHGITTELSKKDKAGIQVFEKEQLFTNLKAGFVDLMFFPGFYLIESWKKIE